MNTNILIIALIALHIALIIFNILKMIAKAAIFIANTIANKSSTVDFRAELYTTSVCTFCVILGIYLFIVYC